eukprot:72124-Chlamydomonas_euryale.AAC.1
MGAVDVRRGVCLVLRACGRSVGALDPAAKLSAGALQHLATWGLCGRRLLWVLSAALSSCGCLRALVSWGALQTACREGWKRTAGREVLDQPQTLRQRMAWHV